MSTPVRLVELQCPGCSAKHWEMDCDFHGTDGAVVPYRTRHYRCPLCGVEGEGFRVQRKSPPEFFLQPHQMYPMSQTDFDFWVEIVKTHFPDHPLLAKLATEWYPQQQVEKQWKDPEWLRKLAAVASEVAEKLDR